jgi:hypothetical protein
MATVVKDPAYLTQTLAYGPQAAQSIRRSQYLADALQQLQESGSQNIRSPAELGMKLLATAVAQHGLNKYEGRTLQAVNAMRIGKAAEAMTALQPPTAAPTSPAAGMPAAPSPAAPAPGVTPVAPPAPVQQQSLNTPTILPQDRLRLAQMVWGEARGEPPEGQQAAAAVALNRARMTGHSVGQEIAAPGQFMGYNPRSQALGEAQLGPILANIDPVISGQAPDPTHGADHFYNPALANPSWGQGQQGQDIGHHRFMALGYGGQPAMGTATRDTGGNPVPPPPAPPQNIAQAGPIADQPFQVAANGPVPMPAPQTPPSAPGSSPPVAGTPPAVPPQASAGGNTGGPPTVLWKPTPQQVDLVKGYLNSAQPGDYERGMALAQAYREKMASPVDYQNVMINGVPFWAPKDPGDGPLVPMGVPQEARSHVATPEQAGITAPPGTSFSVDPLGNVKQAYQPQNGQQAASAPGQPYREAPIGGGTNDPRSPQNIIAGEGKLRDDYDKQIAPYVAAREGYQKVIQAAKGGTPADDIALVFGYMKTLDPGSTVREGEQATVQNSGTIPQTIANMYNKLITGQGRLAPEQRSQFAASAERQFHVYENTYQAANKRFGDIATSYGFEPGRIVRQFDPIQPYAQPAPPPGPAAQLPQPLVSAANRFHQSNAYNPKAPLGDAANPFVARDAATAQRLDTPQNRGKHIFLPDGSMGVIQ